MGKEGIGWGWDEGASTSNKSRHSQHRRRLHAGMKLHASYFFSHLHHPDRENAPLSTSCPLGHSTCLYPKMMFTSSCMNSDVTHAHEREGRVEDMANRHSRKNEQEKYGSRARCTPLTSWASVSVMYANTCQDSSSVGRYFLIHGANCSEHDDWCGNGALL